MSRGILPQPGSGGGSLNNADYELVLSSNSAPATMDFTPEVEAAPLDAAQTAAMLDRLPALPKPEITPAPNLPQGSRPAPRPGQRIDVPFPAPKIDDPVPSGEAQPPQVVRVAPEGEVQSPTALTVVFSQPMVAISSHAELEQVALPVTLEPQISGTWRWMGTQALTFEPDNGFPAATSFTATIDAEVRSLAGLPLGETYSWQFETQRPAPISFFPNHRPQVLRPTLAIAFNQAIHPDNVVGQLLLEADGKRYTVRRLPEEEAFKVDDIRRRFSHLPDTHWFAFKPMFLLPPGSGVTLTVPKGIQGAQGPLPSRDQHVYEFSTYGKLTVENLNCYGRKGCGPSNPWNITFSNPLDANKFTGDWIKVEPEVSYNWDVRGQTLVIRPLSKPKTTYTIHLAGEITDIFGQILERPTSRTVEVGPSPEYFTMQANNFAFLDPRRDPTAEFLVSSYEHVDVVVRKVTVADWLDYQRAQTTNRRNQEPNWPGEIILEKRLKVDAEAGAAQLLTLDLLQSFEASDMLLLHAEPKGGAQSMKERLGRAPRRSHTVWLQHAPVGVHVLASPGILSAFVSSFEDGSPVNGTIVKLVQLKTAKVIAQTKTNRDGLARFAEPDAGLGSLGIVVENGNQQIFLPDNTYFASSDSNWKKFVNEAKTHAFVMDDRSIYKPGEQVHLKGWLRHLEPDQIAPSLPTLVGDIDLTVADTRGNEVLRQAVPLDSYGAFDVSFEIPKDINLGSMFVQMNWQSAGRKQRGYANHNFEVAEFRTPDFEVEMSLPTDHMVVGTAMQAQLQANFYSGEPMSGAAVNWTVTTQDTHFAPPNWSHFQFGKQWPWWCAFWFPQPVIQAQASSNGQTDATGASFLDIDLEGNMVETPLQLTVEGSVQNVNASTISASARGLLHPGEHYVGLKAKRHFAGAGEMLKYDIVVSDLDGNTVPGAVVLFEVFPSQNPLTGVKTSVEAAFSTQIRLDDAPMQLEFSLDEPGSYRVDAKVRDSQARLMTTTLPLWIGKARIQLGEGVAQDRVLIIPDQETYAPGDTANFVVQAPFETGYGVVQVGRHDVLETRALTIKNGTGKFAVKVNEDHVPRLTVHVLINGQRDGVPATAYGSQGFDISRDGYRLDVSVTSDNDAYAPGADAQVEVQVAGGGPANVLLMVVDEAVLALSNYQLRDPLQTFLPDPYWPFTETGSHQHLLLARPELLAADMVEESMFLPEAMSLRSSKEMMARDDASGAAPEGPAFSVRKDFRALAAYAGTLQTDADGRGALHFTLPDRLTRYRIMAVAASADGRMFGTAESTLQTRMPLNVRPNLPRFLNFGDEAMLSFTIQNMTDAERSVQLAVQANRLTFPQGKGRTFTVPAGARVEVRIPAKADAPGTEHVQAAITSEGFSDAVQVELPIYEPATSEAFATYGNVADDTPRAQAVTVPLEAFDQFGGLEITTSATALHGLRDAMDYLRTYPHQFADPLASRILSYLAMRDVLPEFGADYNAKKVEAQLAQDVEALQKMQRGDGGFGLWHSAQESHPFVSVHAANALYEAQRAGMDVSDRTLSRVSHYMDRLPQIMNQLNYHATARFSVQAYSLLVDHKSGRNVGAEATELLGMLKLEDAPLDGLAMLMPVLVNSDRERVWTHIRNMLQETSSTASFTTSGTYSWHVFSSAGRTDALMLRALIEDPQQADLCSKLARGLLAHRQVGRWRTVQENVFVILALSDYFKAFETEAPNFTGSFWLNDQLVSEHRFQSREQARQHTELPMTWLSSLPAEAPLVFEKAGSGRMYYRLGLNYAPRSLDLEAASHGFALMRNYEAVDHPDDVRVDDDGTVRIKRGARVRVKVKMMANGRRYHVALMDRLPAGLEIIDSSLPINEQISIPNSKRRPAPWWYSRWYSHQNLRDERAEAFTLLLEPGVHHYDYVARAIHPGAFVVPPCKAEEMYAPETFGRTATARVIIED